MTLKSLEGKSPQIDPEAFVSEAAYIIGDVVVGPRSSIWPGAVIRADSGRIAIGRAAISRTTRCCMRTPMRESVTE